MKQKTEIKNRVIVIVISLLILFTLIPNISFVKADEKKYVFDETNVLEDLQKSSNFNLMKYPYDVSGLVKSPEIINFVEWCYSFKNELSSDFALYIYFYNPQNKDIDTESFSNRIQIASSYDKYPVDKDSVPLDYETYNLVFCNKSTGDYNNLFYKFRVIDHESTDGLSIRERVNSIERRYDISGIVLATTDGTEKEYTVGGSYMFSGYAKGYGSDTSAQSTLKNTRFTSLETIRLNVDSTTFRTTSSSLGVGHQNDINSVYFSLPNKYINEYGNLQKIKAEWYEYKTEDIYVIDNNYTAYNTLLPKVGESVGSNGDGTYSFGFGFYPGQSPLPNGFTSAYNYKLNQCTLPAVGIVNSYIDKIYYLFNAISIDDILVTSSELKSYITSYSKTHQKGYLPIKDGNISADLFKDNVDTGRTKGYNVKEFDANDKFNILSYDSTNNAWNKFWDYGFTKINTDDGRSNVEPIYIVKDTDLSLSDANISNQLLISSKDASTFKSTANTAKTNDSSMVLFRFAQTDYYSQKGLVCKNGKSTSDDVYEATETVFFDFKIIQLTFTKEGTYKVIPVVSNPIDIVSDITKTPGTKTNIKWLDALLKKIGAYGVLILSIIIGAIIISIELSITKWFSNIGNVPIKVIFLLLMLGLSVIADYYFVNYVMQLIAGLGGL